jgi:hypothetical protein
MTRLSTSSKMPGAFWNTALGLCFSVEYSILGVPPPAGTGFAVTLLRGEGAVLVFVAESTGGGLKIDTSGLGGAQVQMRLRTWVPTHGGRRARRRGSARGRRSKVTALSALSPAAVPFGIKGLTHPERNRRSR